MDWLKSTIDKLEATRESLGEDGKRDIEAVANELYSDFFSIFIKGSSTVRKEDLTFQTELHLDSGTDRTLNFELLSSLTEKSKKEWRNILSISDLSILSEEKLKRPLRLYSTARPWELREVTLSRLCESLLVLASNISQCWKWEDRIVLLDDILKSSKGKPWENHMSRALNSLEGGLAEDIWEYRFLKEWGSLKGSRLHGLIKEPLLRLEVSLSQQKIKRLTLDTHERRKIDVNWKVRKDDPEGSARELIKTLEEEAEKLEGISREVQGRMSVLENKGFGEKIFAAIYPEWAEMDIVEGKLKPRSRIHLSIGSVKTILSERDLSSVADYWESILSASLALNFTFKGDDFLNKLMPIIEERELNGAVDEKEQKRGLRRI